LSRARRGWEHQTGGSNKCGNEDQKRGCVVPNGDARGLGAGNSIRRQRVGALCSVLCALCSERVCFRGRCAGCSGQWVQSEAVQRAVGASEGVRKRGGGDPLFRELLFFPVDRVGWMVDDGWMDEWMDACGPLLGPLGLSKRLPARQRLPCTSFCKNRSC